MGTGFRSFYSLHSVLLASMILGFFIFLAFLYWVFIAHRKPQRPQIIPVKGILANHTLRVLSTMVEVRDRYTAHHSSNVADYALAVARSMGFSEEDCRAIYAGCILHDIGKIYVPDEILLKNGKLTEPEYIVIKEHTLKGHQIIVHFKEFENTFVPNIVLYHHERYDGQGYPMGLSQQEIPLEARIAAICDAYDSMTTTRPYRRALPPEKALGIIRENVGSQFDPEVANHFIKCIRTLGETSEDTANSNRLNYEKTS